MAEVQQFEDLIAWQKARELTRAIFRATDRPGLSTKFGLVDQIERASVSVMSNIAEGFERGSAAEFHQFLYVAKSSCAEVRSLHYVMHDAGYLDDTAFSTLHAQANEVGRVVGGLRTAVARCRDTQRKGRSS